MNNRKRKVLDACLQLFNEKGFHQTSIQDILQRSNISKGTFYNYFASKNECVQAILENRRYDASIRRFELIEGQAKDDVTILARQVAVFMEINKKQNLISLFESIYQSQDVELKNYILRHRLYEIEWMMNRLVDVYGEEARPYTYEAAVIFFSMLHQLAMSYQMAYEQVVDAQVLAETALRHIGVILQKMVEDDVVLLSADTMPILQAQMDDMHYSQQDVYDRLAEFIQRLQQEPNELGEEIGLQILDILKSESPRLNVLELLLKPFREAFTGTSHELESRQLAQMLWAIRTKQKALYE